MRFRSGYASPTPTRRNRSVLWVALGGLAFGVVVVAALIGWSLVTWARPVPEFASLPANPDTSLQGTVAYTEGGCVRAIAASGALFKEVYCWPEMDIEDAQAKGKELGPQLVWLPEGRIEVTMFRMTDPPGPSYNPGWQRIVDVRTGAVTDVPAEDVPSEPNTTSTPTLNPAGDEVTFNSREDGRVTVLLTRADGRVRTLLDVQGPSQGYRMDGFWAPDGSWILADDGRLLIITVDEPSVTRVLAEPPDQSEIGGEFGAAATSENVLGT